MPVTFPHAADVDDDLMEAAAGLLSFGWAAPGALTARVAIERGLHELVDAFGVWVPEKPSPGDMADRLYRKRRPMAPHLGSCTRVYGRLSGVAHGGDVSIEDATDLLASVQEIVDDWRSVCQSLE